MSSKKRMTAFLTACVFAFSSMTGGGVNSYAEECSQETVILEDEDKAEDASEVVEYDEVSAEEQADYGQVEYLPHAEDEAEGVGSVEEADAGDEAMGAEALIEDEEIETDADKAQELIEEDAAGADDMEVIYSEEIMELEDATVTSDYIPDTFSMFALQSYDGCFGNQLDQEARELYDARVQTYIQERATGNCAVVYASAEKSPIQFDAAIEKNDEGKNGIVKNEDYTEAVQMAYAIAQMAGDAFQYDYPQAFWLRGGGIGLTLAATYDKTQKQYIGYIVSIEYRPTIAFAGADQMIDAFDEGVERVAAKIQDSADYNQDGKTEAIELAAGIHDYLCERFFYDTEGLTTFQQAAADAKDYHIYSATGAFVDSDTIGTGVVCEGYARAYKVLCDKFGIPCTLVGGVVTQTSGREGHMWNGVNIDGKWYLVDATWDDNKTGYTRNYFLEGTQKVYAKRTENGNFSGAQNTKVFTYPEFEKTVCDRLSPCHYMWDNGEVTREATCMEAGERTYHCTNPECTETKTEVLPAPGHRGGTATCTQKAVCEVCGEEYGELAPHTVTQWIIIQERTCMVDGIKEGICTVCGQTETEVNPARGHTVVEDAEVAPTCTETGKSAGSHCSVCGEVLKAQEDIPAHGHTVVEDAAVASTCTKTGKTAGSHCSVCGEVLKAQEEIPALGHKGGTATCTQKAVCEVCGEGYGELAPHTVEEDAAVASTCTAAGKTAGSHCSVCGKVLKAQEEIPVLDHTVVEDAAVAPTCTAAGKTAGSHCSVCGEVLKAQEEIPALGHKGGTATCTQKAVCEVCGEGYGELAPHTVEEDAAVAPTCTAAGKAAGSHCSVCGKVLEKQEKIPATGNHTYAAPVVTREATVLAEGVETRTCTVCGYKVHRTLPRLQPTMTLNAPKTVPMKEKQVFTITVSGLAKGDDVASWKSSKTSVVTVKNGKLTAKKAGTAKITVTLASGKTAQITVKVKKTAVKTTKISFVGTGKKITLKKGKKMTLKTQLTPITSLEKVTFTTSDKKCVSVSSKGVIKGVKKGKAVITAKSGKKSVKVTVTVK